MKKILNVAVVFTCFVFLFGTLDGFCATGQLTVDEYLRPLSPAKIHAKADREILKHVRNTHYLKPSIDDRLSTKILDSFLSELDPQRSFFLAQDIREFDVYRFEIDDMLKTGNLSPIFEIYCRYQQRMVERLNYMTLLVESRDRAITFDADEFFDTDRKDDPWPRTRAELEDLWFKGLKAEILNLLLEDKTLDEARDILSRRYRSQLNRSVRINENDVFQIFMNSFVQTFDPHTQYFSPRQSENFSIDMSLSLEGIGAMLGVEDDYVKVVRLIPAGPADKSGELKPDDRIVGVGQGPDGDIVDVVGWRLDDVVDLIRGPKETVVRLKIIPAQAADDTHRRIISIVRNTVKLEEQAASSEIVTVDDGDGPRRIGVITIPAFYLDFGALNSGSSDYRSTTRDVKKLLAELKQARVEGIVIDLRDNGGGSLQEASTLTGLFIEKGPVVQIRYANQRVERLHDSDPGIYWDGPLAVLVNRLSASASEIFAGAIQDYGRGIIIGENTFGKGTVQSLITLDHGQLKLTSAKFYRVSGASTQHRGITPDIIYPSLYDHGKIGEDALEKALPWDTIPGITYPREKSLAPLIARLNDLHLKRMETDPDYLYLKDMTAHLSQLRSKTQVSLNLETRIREQQEMRLKRLELENRFRSAKGKPAFKDLQAMLEEEKKEKDRLDARETPAQDDPVLVESARILTDLIRLARPAVPPGTMARGGAKAGSL
ncbi:MAG: carboxy terminal-processing peptidase [Desulfomonilia bacterium]|jgi:carboxyl-terminal processing protease